LDQYIFDLQDWQVGRAPKGSRVFSGPLRPRSTRRHPRAAKSAEPPDRTRDQYL